MVDTQLQFIEENLGSYTTSESSFRHGVILFLNYIHGKLKELTGDASNVGRDQKTVAASQTDSVLVAAVAAKKIRVRSIFALVGNTATDITFKTKLGAAASTAISPTFSNLSNSGAVLPFNPDGWFETGVGEALVATTGAGSSTGLLFTYELVD